MKKKVIIIAPAGASANVFKNFMHLPLLGPFYLGTILEQAGFEVVIYNEYNVEDEIPLHYAHFDFLLLSLITPTLERGHKIASNFRKINPKIKIIIGGIHPTLHPDESLEFADIVVKGEAEEIIVDLLKNDLNLNERIITTKHLTDLDKIPIPNFNLMHSKELLKIYPIITSRGCPHDCSFCSVSKTFGRKYRVANVNKIIEEISTTVRQNQIFFYDDNFTADKDRVKYLLHQMLLKNIKKEWIAQTRIDIADDDELLSLMKRSGCKKIYLGLESISNQVLKEYKKSQTIEDIEEGLKKIHAAGIAVHGMFIFGSDSDTPQIFKKTVEFCKKNKIETSQYLALTPFPGTQIYQEMEKSNRVLHKKWSYYDTIHVVFKPKSLSALDLQNNIISSFEEFYSCSNIIKEFILSIIRFKKFDISSFNIHKSALKIINEWKKNNLQYLKLLENKTEKEEMIS
ncbi:MAG: radical SAM protein [Oligoflexia bacterium]|nr:radical SAM protein [Oligoflexia bacterium]